MTLIKLALAPLVFGALVTVDASAAPATSPVLAKRQTTVSSSGRIRTSDCRVFTDRVLINRNFDGVTTSEEKNFKLGGAYETKIDEVIATPAQTKVVGPLEMSYDIVAYRTSASGTTGEIILSSFDGVKGTDVFNPSSAAIFLKEVLNSVCGGI